MDKKPHERKNLAVFPNFEPVEIETYQSPSSVAKELSLSDMPSVSNGILRFRKYRVKIELIEEPVEILHDRLLYLWDKCTNANDAERLRSVADALDFKLQGPWGIDLTLRR